MKIVRATRRLAERLICDPFADVVSCGICWAWVPGSSWESHIEWHRRLDPLHTSCLPIAPAKVGAP